MRAGQPVRPEVPADARVLQPMSCLHHLDRRAHAGSGGQPAIPRERARGFERLSEIERLAALVVLSAVLAGCGNAPAVEEDSTTTITILHPGDERGLGLCWDMSARLLFSSPLVGVDQAGEIEPRLATRWDRADDGTWTVHLRSDVRWHDGVPFTARDVKFTWDMVMHPDFAWMPPGAIQIEVLDDTTFSARYTRGSGSPVDAWNVYYPEHLLKDLPPADLCSWDYWAEQVGNGPFRFVRRVPKTLVELEANPDYFRRKPRIDRVILKFGESGITELLAGNVDVANVSPADMLKLNRDPRFRTYYGVQAISAVAIYWNQEAHPAFADPRVRRALTLAIDRRQLHQLLDLPADLPLYDGLSNRRVIQSGTLPPPLPHDTVAAGRLLTEAGWLDADGDGVREKDGVPLRFDLLAETDRSSVFVQDQLRRVGAEAKVLMQPRGSTLHRFTGGDYEALISGFWNMLYGGQAQLRVLGEDNNLGYRSPEVLAILDSLRATSDPAQVDRLARRLHDVTARDLPLTVLHPHVSGVAAHRRVKGLSEPWRADAIYYLEDLWIEEEG